MVTLLFSVILVDIGQTDAPVLTAIIVLLIVVLGFRLAFHILPSWVGSFISDVVSFFMRLILGTGLKGRK
jgi:hypothetical protein